MSKVECRDWSKEMFDKNGWVDNLNVGIVSKEFKYFLTYEAYP